AKLVVAGKVSDEDSDRTVRKFLSNKNVRYFPGFVKNDDVQVYFNAADVSVLPYKNILTSGAALLSLSFDTPILAPRAGVLPELIKNCTEGFLYDSYEDMQLQMLKLARAHMTGEWDPKRFSYARIRTEYNW